MDKHHNFAIWAPDDVCWSRWVKPVLFAYLDHHLPSAQLPDIAWETNFVPAAETRPALVLDLPGADGVLFGLKLAASGYRPVPLYNAVPLPGGRLPFNPISGRPLAAVDVSQILIALRRGTEILGGLKLAADAPPAFLLDAHRHAEGRKMHPNEFDNRSVCFTTDFPSANFLAAQRVASAVLIQRYSDHPQPDLAHILRRWQDAGLPVFRMQLDLPEAPVPCHIPRPSWFGTMFQRALAAVGLRRSARGGFGAWVPEASAGG